MLSIIIPVFNEAESLLELTQQISSVCTEHKIEFEAIFIDDGSDDGSWSVIEEISKQNSEYSGIQLRRNFGKAAALTAGMQAAKGELILMMDADLQDDPKEIPGFLEKIEKKSKKTHRKHDVINGWKQKRFDPWHKVYPSRVFNWMIGRMTGLKLHDHNCGLKLFRKEVAEEIQIYGELHRFIPVLAHARGFQVTEMVVNHRSRQFGYSKYGIRRFLRGFLDLMTVSFLIMFGQRPQHMLGAFGLLFFGLGIFGLGFLATIWVFMNVFPVFTAVPIGGRPLLAYSIASTLLGAQAISLGLLAELMVANTAKDQNYFAISQTTHDLPSKPPEELLEEKLEEDDDRSEEEIAI